MYYKPCLDESVDRFRKLWAREYPDRILVKIDVQDPETPTVMNAMARVPDYREMMDEWEKGFELNRNVVDDNLPVVYGELGPYIIGGFLGAEVSWGTGGAYSKKLITDMSKFSEYLHFDESNGYFHMQLDYIRYLSERSRGRFGFTEMVAVDGLNFLDCVRGGEAYTDLFDYPEQIIQIMDFASDLNVEVVKAQRALMTPYWGGRFIPYQLWAPDDTIFISVDAYGQCSAEIFERFGRKYVQRLIDEFADGWLHVHSDAMRLLPNYVSLEGLLAIGLEDWIKPPMAMDHIDEIIDITGDIPLMINITKTELLQRIEGKTLPGNVLYWVGGIRSAEVANRVARIAYDYRARTKRKSF